MTPTDTLHQVALSVAPSVAQAKMLSFSHFLPYTTLAVWGMIFMMTCYILARFIQSRAVMYATYAAYMTGWLVYFGMHEITMLEGMDNYGIWHRWLDTFSQAVTFGLYFLFAHAFLDMRRYFPKIEFFTRVLGFSFLVYAIIDSIFLFSQTLRAINPIEIDRIRDLTFLVIRIITLFSAAYIITYIYVFRHLDPMASYFCIGSSLFFIGSLSAFVASLPPVCAALGLKQLDTIFCLEVAVFCDILAYSIGLGYLEHISEEEKIKALEDKQVLQDQLNNELGRLVNEKTKEVLSKNAELEAERSQKMTATHDRELAKLELRLLRSQINPHFVFNSINSIKGFIVKNDTRTAVSYINKFAALIRLILNYSRNSNVKLAEEIACLRAYTELENMRFEKNFDFTIDVNEKEIDLENAQIPPMIIQPYVENAIRHGLLNKETKGKLSISFKKEENQLVCIIEDDGVGREAAANLKARPLHQSLGMQITEERIALANDIAGNANHEAQIIDLHDATGIAIGTKVEIRFPYRL
jgi:sensor histidine kinase YesM